MPPDSDGPIGIGSLLGSKTAHLVYSLSDRSSELRQRRTATYFRFERLQRPRSAVLFGCRSDLVRAVPAFSIRWRDRVGCADERCHQVVDWSDHEAERLAAWLSR